MNKKRIIMMAAAGLLSFAGAFAFAWFAAPKTSPQSEIESESGELGEPTLTAYDSTGKLQLPEAETMSSVGTVDSEIKKGMTVRQLKNLVYEVREKTEEYDSKLQGLEVREQRLQIARNLIKKDIEELNNLRVELTLIITSLKEKQAKLKARLIEINKVEKNNLMTIAATYDKMDVTSAGKILTNMSEIEKGEFGESSFDDAVKILHYMTERTKAKLLAELVTSEPKLAAALCRRLKQVVEEE